MQVIYQMANLAKPKQKNCANICAVGYLEAKTNKLKEKKGKAKSKNEMDDEYECESERKR